MESWPGGCLSHNRWENTKTQLNSRHSGPGFGHVSAEGMVLTLDLNIDSDGMLLEWENMLDSILWHELLLPFIRGDASDAQRR